ncbi:MAG: glycine/betaine ABC transporter substrate-binding protein [Actinomycetia bacterium]|nr:glycine/betaine ABC transporter substrate-binding protein [Actinomycetes bacterium]
MQRLWKVVVLGVIASITACSGNAGDSSGPAPADGIRITSVDLVPEYLGTALRFFGASTTSSDSTASEADLGDLLAERGLIALDAASAQDANAIITTRGIASELGWESISDLSGHAATLRFGGPVECPDRPLCLQGLRDVYGLQFSSFVSLGSLAVTAEALRRDEIDVGLMFTTATELADPELVALLDDLGLQPAENVIPLLSQSALDRWGSPATEALNAVSVLTTDELREMNRLVGDGAPVAEVVSAWLMSHGLPSSG